MEGKRQERGEVESDACFRSIGPKTDPCSVTPTNPLGSSELKLPAWFQHHQENVFVVWKCPLQKLSARNKAVMLGGGAFWEVFGLEGTATLKRHVEWSPSFLLLSHEDTAHPTPAYPELRNHLESRKWNFNLPVTSSWTCKPPELCEINFCTF
jgi:hypothetical protein